MIFCYGFKCSDAHKIEKSNKLSNNIFEWKFYQDHSNRKHNLFPFENSKNESDRVVDLLIFVNYYVLKKKLHVFLGNDKKS